MNNNAGEIPQEICDLVNLEVIDFIVMFGNTNYLIGEIPDCICNELKTSSDQLTYELNWKKNDLLMIDNKLPKSNT